MTTATSDDARPAGTADHPPEPWHLRGTMDVSLWRLPASSLPSSVAATLPRGVHPVRAGGQVLVGAASVRYEPGGVLVYDELLAATLVRQGSLPRVTVSDIWVDSPASRAGGRLLWGIPKELASFERRRLVHRSLGEVTEVRATADATLLAELRVAPGGRLPGRWRLPLATAQRLDGIETVSEVRSVGVVRHLRAAWRFPPDSPLAWLRGTPLTSVRLEDLTLRFGSA